MSYTIKHFILILIILAGNYDFSVAKGTIHFYDSVSVAQDSIIFSPEEIVQKQLEAYNARDLEAFLSYYSDNVKAYNFPDKEIFSGKNLMRAGYEAFFSQNPDLLCVVLQRMVMNDVVIDYERITGLSDGKDLNSIAIFKIENGKVSQIYFIGN